MHYARGMISNQQMLSCADTKFTYIIYTKLPALPSRKISSYFISIPHFKDFKDKIVLAAG
jgi:hypothetical protein